MTINNLSSTAASNLAYIRAKGSVVRMKGIYWAAEDAETTLTGIPTNYVSDEELKYLLRHNLIVVTARSETGDPIRVSVADAAISN